MRPCFTIYRSRSMGFYIIRVTAGGDPILRDALEKIRFTNLAVAYNLVLALRSAFVIGTWHTEESGDRK